MAPPSPSSQGAVRWPQVPAAAVYGSPVPLSGHMTPHFVPVPPMYAMAGVSPGAVPPSPGASPPSGASAGRARGPMVQQYYMMPMHYPQGHWPQGVQWSPPHNFAAAGSWPGFFPQPAGPQGHVPPTMPFAGAPPRTAPVPPPAPPPEPGVLVLPMFCILLYQIVRGAFVSSGSETLADQVVAAVCSTSVLRLWWFRVVQGRGRAAGAMLARVPPGQHVQKASRPMPTAPGM